MSTPCARVRAGLERMAELRAGGLGWEAVAKDLGVSPETCRRWTREHAREWKRLYREAEQAVWLEVRAEARLVLRKHMRSEDSLAAILAAKLLLAESRRSLARTWRQISEPVEEWRQDSAPVE